MSPIYIYFCVKCDKHFDIRLPIEERKTRQVCKKCGETLDKVSVFKTSFILKGSWPGKDVKK